MTSHSSLKGIILPTQPLPPEQALGEDFLGTIQIKETKPKKIKSENSSEATFVKCEFCDYCCDKVRRTFRLGREKASNWTTINDSQRRALMSFMSPNHANISPLSSQAAAKANFLHHLFFSECTNAKCNAGSNEKKCE